MNKDIIESKKSSICNDRFTLVETVVSNVSDISSTTLTVTEKYLKKNYSDLIYSKINQTVNELLTSNEIVKMPILHHSNVYFVKEYTESPISNFLLSRNPTYKIVMKYDGDNSTNNSIPIYANVSSNNFQTNMYTKESVYNQNIVNKLLITHMFLKTKQVIETLNTHLSRNNIQIKKASLEFCCKQQAKLEDSITNSYPEIITNLIFLKPIINIFDTFTFIETSTNNNITNVIKIYKAFTNKDNVDIESQKSKEEVIQEFKRLYNL